MQVPHCAASATHAVPSLTVTSCLVCSHKHVRLPADLPCLPSSITCLSHLRNLDLSGNPLQEAPVQLRHLTSLTRLDLGRCDAKELLPAGLMLPRLQFLDLSDNQLASLPSDMALPSLQQLRLSYNQLQSLPDTLRLPSLVVIDLSTNAFRWVACE